MSTKPINVKNETYQELSGIKGMLIAKKKENISFSDAIDWLIEFYSKNKVGIKNVENQSEVI